MITGNITAYSRYPALYERLEKALNYLRTTDTKQLPAGKYAIDGDLVFAEVQEYTTKPDADCPFESHRQYFDVQYMADGIERFETAPAADMTPSVDYDENRDLIFYQEPACSYTVTLRTGDFAVVSPEEAHAPRRIAGSPCPVKKVVVKVHI